VGTTKDEGPADGTDDGVDITGKNTDEGADEGAKELGWCDTALTGAELEATVLTMISWDVCEITVYIFD